MRRLHIRINLPPNTDDDLRKAYGPANDREWMIPFDDNIAVEHVATIIAARYRSRYPDFTKAAPLRIRKISDGYGMVPDRGSLVREIWEERRVGLAPEEYTVHATRDNLSTSEIALLRTRLSGEREFSMAPESSARIQKRPYTHDINGSSLMGPPLFATSQPSPKRARVDCAPSTADSADPRRSVELLDPSFDSRLTPIAIEDSQPLQDQSIMSYVPDRSPKTESPEPDATNYHSVAASQLDTPDSSSEEYESAGETNTTTNAPQSIVEETGQQPQSPQDQDEDSPTSAPSSVAADQQPLEHSIFDVPDEEAYQLPLSRSYSSASEARVRPTTTADLLAENRRANQNEMQTSQTRQKSVENSTVAAEQTNSKKKSPAFRKPILLPADSEIEDDADNERVTNDESEDHILRTLAEGIRKRKHRRSRSRSEQEHNARTSASPPTKRGRTSPLQAPGSICRSPREDDDPSIDSSMRLHDAVDASSTFVPMRAAARRSREANRLLYDQLHNQEAEWAEMMRIDSSPQQRALTPMIPKSKLKPALKITTPRPDGERSTSTPDTSKASETRRSVSFSDLPSPKSASATQLKHPSMSAITPKTPANQGKQSAGDNTHLSSEYRKAPSLSYWDEIWKMRQSGAGSDDSPKPINSAPHKTSGGVRAERMRIDTPGRNDTTEEPSVQNDQPRSTPSKPKDQKQGKHIKATDRAASTPLRTPERNRAEFEIRGDVIRSSAAKRAQEAKAGHAPREEEPDARNYSSAEPDAVHNMSPHRHSKSPQMTQTLAVATHETSEADIGERAASIVRSDGSTGQRHMTEHDDAHGTLQKNVTDIAISAGSPNRDTDAESEPIEPERRSPARQVESSQESETESESSSEDGNEAVLQNPALPDKLPITIHPTDNADRLGTSPPRPSENSQIESSSDGGSDTEEEDEQGDEKQRSSVGADASKYNPDPEVTSSDGSDSESTASSSASKKPSKARSETHFAAGGSQSQQIKSPAPSSATKLANAHSFNAIRQQSLNNQDMKSKLPPYKNPTKYKTNQVSPKPPGGTESASDSDEDDSDSTSDDSDEGSSKAPKGRISAFQSFAKMIRVRS